MGNTLQHFTPPAGHGNWWSVLQSCGPEAAGLNPRCARKGIQRNVLLNLLCAFVTTLADGSSPPHKKLLILNLLYTILYHHSLLHYTPFKPITLHHFIIYFTFTPLCFTFTQLITLYHFRPLYANLYHLEQTFLQL